MDPTDRVITNNYCTIIQNVRFQVGICSENFELEQIQNGRLSAIINFNMPDIW